MLFRSIISSVARKNSITFELKDLLTITAAYAVVLVVFVKASLTISTAR